MSAPHRFVKMHRWWADGTSWHPFIPYSAEYTVKVQSYLGPTRSGTPPPTVGAPLFTHDGLHQGGSVRMRVMFYYTRVTL